MSSRTGQSEISKSASELANIFHSRIGIGNDKIPTVSDVDYAILKCRYFSTHA